ncbi:MAG: hypothetical protein BGO95_10445 [Micrococcales bacterium 73-13]|nr:MAG: hypothetical protein BGO95_10445 [Micrococcales bacterium 73-13]
MTENRRRTGLIWALLGGLVLVVVLIVFLVATLGSGGGSPGPAPTTPGASSTPAPSSPGTSGAVVDPEAAKRGWVPEPITRNPDEYARAALLAAGTFDTNLSSRAEWVAWLQTWFTPSPLYTNEQDAADQLARYRAELDSAVLLPQATWDDLADEDGRVSARIDGDLDWLELPETADHRVSTVTADVILTYTRTTPTGEVDYDETVRVSVQVVCDGASVPTSGTAQQVGDCKVVRYFDEAVS